MADVIVPNEVPSIIVIAVTNGQVAFDYDFRADLVTDLKAELRPVNGDPFVEFVGGTDFIASGLGTAAGGTIALTSFTGTKIGDSLAIYRDIPIERQNDYSRDLFADDLNAEQDRVFMIMQELQRDIDRSAKTPIGGSEIIITPGTGGQVATFDENGNIIGTTPEPGLGNMQREIYDPLEVGGDAFDRGNHHGQSTERYIMPADQSAHLAAPPLINNWQYEWNINQFAGGETERAKSLATRDYGPVFQNAFETGEMIKIPYLDGYPVRSLNGPSGTHGVEIINTPVDVRMHKAAKIIAGDVFWNAPHNVLQFQGSGNDANEDETFTDMTVFKWEGGIMSAQQLTLDHGTGAGFGNGFMNLVGMFMPQILGVDFWGGTVAPTLNLVGAGAMDTHLGLNACVAPKVDSCSFIGPFDLGIYLNGPRIYTTLPNNSLASSNGSAGVTVTYVAHGMRNGDRCHLKGVVAFNNVTLPDGEYGISGVTADTFVVQSTTVANATGAGGGASVVVLNSRSNKRSESILGEDGIIQNCWFTRCANGAIGSKRNNRGIQILNNTFRSCGAGVSTSGIDAAEGADGKRMKIIGNGFYRTLGHPIRLLGGGPETIIQGNIIENFGRQLFDGGATHVNFSSDLPVAGIAVYSLLRPQITGNQIRMTDNYVGATWEPGEEPAAIKLRRNTDYESGCADALIAGNMIEDVPQPYNDENTGLRTRIESDNHYRNASKVSVYGSAGVLVSVNKSLVSPSMSLAATGVVTANIPHGLDYTPAVGSCIISLGTTTTNSFALAWIRVVSTDATNVAVAINVTTAAVGQSLTLNVHVR